MLLFTYGRWAVCFQAVLVFLLCTCASYVFLPSPQAATLQIARRSADSSTKRNPHQGPASATVLISAFSPLPVVSFSADGTNGKYANHGSSGTGFNTDITPSPFRHSFASLLPLFYAERSLRYKYVGIAELSSNAEDGDINASHNETGSFICSESASVTPAYLSMYCSLLRDYQREESEIQKLNGICIPHETVLDKGASKMTSGNSQMTSAADSPITGSMGRGKESTKQRNHLSRDGCEKRDSLLPSTRLTYSLSKFRIRATHSCKRTGKYFFHLATKGWRSLFSLHNLDSSTPTVSSPLNPGATIGRPHEYPRVIAINGGQKKGVNSMSRFMALFTYKRVRIRFRIGAYEESSTGVSASRAHDDRQPPNLKEVHRLGKHHTLSISSFLPVVSMSALRNQPHRKGSNIDNPVSPLECNYEVLYLARQFIQEAEAAGAFKYSVKTTQRSPVQTSDRLSGATADYYNNYDDMGTDDQIEGASVRSRTSHHGKHHREDGLDVGTRDADLGAEATHRASVYQRKLTGDNDQDINGWLRRRGGEASKHSNSESSAGSKRTIGSSVVDATSDTSHSQWRVDDDDANDILDNPPFRNTQRGANMKNVNTDELIGRRRWDDAMYSAAVTFLGAARREMGGRAPPKRPRQTATSFQSSAQTTAGRGTHRNEVESEHDGGTSARSFSSLYSYAVAAWGGRLTREAESFAEMVERSLPVASMPHEGSLPEEPNSRMAADAKHSVRSDRKRNVNDAVVLHEYFYNYEFSVDSLQPVCLRLSSVTGGFTEIESDPIHVEVRVTESLAVYHLASSLCVLLFLPTIVSAVARWRVMRFMTAAAIGSTVLLTVFVVQRIRSVGNTIASGGGSGILGTLVTSVVLAAIVFAGGGVREVVRLSLHSAASIATRYGHRIAGVMWRSVFSSYFSFLFSQPQRRAPLGGDGGGGYAREPFSLFSDDGYTSGLKTEDAWNGTSSAAVVGMVLVVSAVVAFVVCGVLTRALLPETLLTFVLRAYLYGAVLGGITLVTVTARPESFILLTGLLVAIRLTALVILRTFRLRTLDRRQLSSNHMRMSHLAKDSYPTQLNKESSAADQEIHSHRSTDSAIHEMTPTAHHPWHDEDEHGTPLTYEEYLEDLQRQRQRHGASGSFYNTYGRHDYGRLWRDDSVDSVSRSDRRGGGSGGTNAASHFADSPNRRGADTNRASVEALWERSRVTETALRELAASLRRHPEIYAPRLRDPAAVYRWAGTEDSGTDDDAGSRSSGGSDER